MKKSPKKIYYVLYQLKVCMVYLLVITHKVKDANIGWGGGWLYGLGIILLSYFKL